MFVDAMIEACCLAQIPLLVRSLNDHSVSQSTIGLDKHQDFL
jgi:hypothetical protein